LITTPHLACLLIPATIQLAGRLAPYGHDLNDYDPVVAAGNMALTGEELREAVRRWLPGHKVLAASCCRPGCPGPHGQARHHQAPPPERPENPVGG
jgi:hypothetical protein